MSSAARRKPSAANRPNTDQRDRLTVLSTVVADGLAALCTTRRTISETEPGMQGDRVSGARKAATLETGFTLQVPLFVNVGDRVKVDTRTGEYLSRS